MKDIVVMHATTNIEDVVNNCTVPISPYFDKGRSPVLSFLQERELLVV